MSNSIGYATFQLVPVAPNISQQITQIITTPLQRAGQLAGQQGGQAIAQGLRSQVSTVEQASRALAGARDREADAAGRVRVAEANLQQLRSQGVTSGARLVRAEEDLERARRGNAAATGQAQRAQRDLAEATRNTAQANQQVASSTSDASSATGWLSERFKGAAGDLKTFAAGAVGVAAAMKIITDAMDFEVINDNLAASLGATPEVAKQYGETTANVYKQAFGDSMESVAEAVGSVSSSFKTLGTDGEQSRQHFVHGFLEQVDGIDFEHKVEMGIRNDRYKAMVPQVVSALKLRGRVHAGFERCARLLGCPQRGRGLAHQVVQDHRGFPALIGDPPRLRVRPSRHRRNDRVPRRVVVMLAQLVEQALHRGAHAGVVANLAGRALRDRAAEVQDVDPVGGAQHHGHVVLDEEHTDSPVIGEAADEVTDFPALLLVQAGGRLVQQQDRRPGGDGARDCHETALAVGKVLGADVEYVGQAEFADCGQHLRPGGVRLRVCARCGCRLWGSGCGHGRRGGGGRKCKPTIPPN